MANEAVGPTVNVDFTVQMAEFGAGYRITTWRSTEVCQFLGVDGQTKFEVNFQAGPQFIDSGDDWFDVFAGYRWMD